LKSLQTAKYYRFCCACKLTINLQQFFFRRDPWLDLDGKLEQTSLFMAEAKKRFASIAFQFLPRVRTAKNGRER